MLLQAIAIRLLSVCYGQMTGAASEKIEESEGRVSVGAKIVSGKKHVHLLV